MAYKERSDEEIIAAKAVEAQVAFVQEYLKSEPFSEYVNHVGITWFAVLEWLKRGRAGSPDEVAEELKNAGQNPKELYLIVGLGKPLPDNLKLPDVYKGFKVFVVLMGEMTLY